MKKSNINFQKCYAGALNPDQLAAVTHTQGPLLVIAGAGSGKTRTLTYRAAYLVAKGVSPSAILLLTFTRKASQEMLRRATQLLDERCGKIAGGTFHSFANATLRQYASHMGLDPAFGILDRNDSENLIGLLRKELQPVTRQRSFPRSKTLADIFSRAVNKGLSLDEVIENDYPHFESHLETISRLYRLFEIRKQEHHFLDYDDLLVYLRRLLAEYPDVRDRISKRYHHIMVDEYQDTNTIQAEILYLLTRTHQNIMVVGDDAQSIYAFRGANFRNIIDFPKRFPAAQIVSLEENYRSNQPVLTLTNAIIARAKEKFTKNLFSQKKDGAKPVLLNAEDEYSQSRFIVDRIKDFQNQGVPINEIAVLFRASFHSFDLEIELSREGIAFVKMGGFKFVESAHIKDVLAHMRVMANVYDRISWYRILLLLEKVGPKTAQKIFEATLAEKSGYTGLLSAKVAGSKALERLKMLFATLDTKPMTVGEMGQIIVDYYMPILKNRFDDHPRRARDLEHLADIMERYKSLDAFLTDMALEPPTVSFENSLYADAVGSDRLTLSTIHSAKGLEWRTVFVIWALDGRFPSVHSLHKEDELEEELRLMYVAATRAKENLFFTYPSNIWDRGTGLILNQPSRFLDNIPDDILEKEYEYR
ncbi:MAG: ATP-dependent helicase [Deltaproteobacteria bacterium]|jgi:DNA helicase-2/ATP-dependent DNA helicase PcrA|nr:ATP-dependent helicase [Deltaproteobacteria bacterium]